MTQDLTVFQPVRLVIYTRAEQCFFGIDAKPKLEVRRRFVNYDRAVAYLHKWVCGKDYFVLPDAEITAVAEHSESTALNPEIAEPKASQSASTKEKSL